MSSSGACDGCLGSLRCWVCLGVGTLNNRQEQPAPCPRCHGSGACFVCQPELIGDVPQSRPRRWATRG